MNTHIAYRLFIRIQEAGLGCCSHRIHLCFFYTHSYWTFEKKVGKKYYCAFIESNKSRNLTHMSTIYKHGISAPKTMSLRCGNLYTYSFPLRPCAFYSSEIHIPSSILCYWRLYVIKRTLCLDCVPKRRKALDTHIYKFSAGIVVHIGYPISCGPVSWLIGFRLLSSCSSDCQIFPVPFPHGRTVVYIYRVRNYWKLSSKVLRNYLCSYA